MSKRLDSLKISLEKKETAFNEKLNTHFNDVRGAQGEPMRGHRGSERVLRRWEKQEASLQILDASIDKTKKAIEREQHKIAVVDAMKNVLPSYVLEMVEKGELIQWRKYPNRFFLPDIKKARFIFDTDKKIWLFNYFRQLPQDELTLFKEMANKLKKLQEAQQ